MQDIAPFSPTLQLQHATLTTSLVFSHETPLAYASYQVEQGQLEEAIETLERGRASLWSEMRRLRTSIDQLLDADPELGHKFAALNGDLDELTKSIPPSHKLNMDDVVVDDLRAGDQFGSLLLRQRGLLKARDKLISQIRALPGFDRFLTFPLFDTLRSAASSGPVVIVNHSEPCSDILILLYNASPSLIPTPDDFYNRASALKDKLLTSRVKDGLDSSQYDEALASVLMELYELVGKPVIDRLRNLQIQEQTRIWWCPTSVFCSLPLHTIHLMVESYVISWISSSVPIPHRCPPSSNAVVVIPARDLRIALQSFLSYKLTHLFQLWEARSKLSGLSMPR